MIEKIFRVVVSGYDEYYPKDFYADGKTIEDFDKTVQEGIRFVTNNLEKKNDTINNQHNLNWDDNWS